MHTTSFDLLVHETISFRLVISVLEVFGVIGVRVSGVIQVVLSFWSDLSV